MAERVGFRVAAVSVQRPIFRGDKAGVWAASCRGLRSLADAAGFELAVREQAVTDGEEAVVAARELTAAAPDLVLVQATTFATADCFVPLLRTGRPTCLWAVPEAPLGGPLPLNSLCGVNFVTSLGGPERVKWLYGDVSSGLFRERFETTFRALRTVAALRGARILSIGGTAPTFDRFAVDAAAVSQRFGATVETVELEELFASVERVSPAEAESAAAEMLAEAGGGGIDAAGLRPAGRLDVALRRLVVEAGYDGVAIRCWPECAETTGAMPCASVGRLFDAGCPAACEGDVLGVVSLLALQHLGDDDPALLDLSHWSGDRLVFWHCGNAPKSLAAGGITRLETHFNRPDTPCVRAMRMEPGEATMLRFTGVGEAALFEGRWVAGPVAFDGVSGWFGETRWNGSEPLAARDVVATVLDRGLPHHFAFASGHLAEPAVELCAWLGLTLTSSSRWRAGLRPEAAARGEVRDED